MSAALVASLVYLRLSQMGGRLSADINYDDISYVNDAAQRIWVAAHEGVLSFLWTFVAHPPHSPFSTALATVAELAGGTSDKAFYVANFAIVAAAAWIMARMLRAAPSQTFLLLLAALLTSHLIERTVIEFRPDLCLGLVTTAMAWVLVDGVLACKKGAAWRAGLLFGACLLIKPSFFAHTLAVALALTGVMIGLRAMLWEGAPPERRVLAAKLGGFWAVGLLIAAPYYLLNGAHAVEYFWTNTRGEQAGIWSYPVQRSVADLAVQYLKDAVNLSKFHALLAGAVFVVGFILLVRRRCMPEVRRLAVMAMVGTVSFAIMVVGRHRNPYFLATVDWTVLFLGMYAYVSAERILGPFSRGASRIVLLLALLFTVHANEHLITQPNPPSEAMGRASWNRQIADAILLHQDDRAGSTVRTAPKEDRVFFSFAGPVNSDTVRWEAYKEGRQLQTFDLHRSGDFSAAIRAAQESAYVVVPNVETASFERALPSNAIQAPFTTWISSDPDFKALSPLRADAHYFVFYNSAKLGRHEAGAEEPARDGRNSP